MNPRDIKDKRSAERVFWIRGEDAVIEYLHWLVSGTLNGAIPIQ